jgi:hypothetical protein
MNIIHCFIYNCVNFLEMIYTRIIPTRMIPTFVLDLFKCVHLTKVNGPLGRWTNHNHKQTVLKIKYANEDNCGISGISYTNNQLDDKQYIYFMGYDSIHK